MKWKWCIKTADPSLLHPGETRFFSVKKSTQSTIGRHGLLTPSGYAPGWTVVCRICELCVCVLSVSMGTRWESCQHLVQQLLDTRCLQNLLWVYQINATNLWPGILLSVINHSNFYLVVGIILHNVMGIRSCINFFSEWPVSILYLMYITAVVCTSFAISKNVRFAVDDIYTCCICILLHVLYFNQWYWMFVYL